MSFHRIKLKLLLIKLLFLHFGRYLQIGTMDFRTAYMIRKHLDGILFSDIIVEVSAASLEKLRMKVYCQRFGFGDKMSLCFPHFFIFGARPCENFFGQT